MRPRPSHRRAPFTPLPTCGTSTIISSRSDSTNSHGATFSQVATGTWNATSAAMKDSAMKIAWRYFNEGQRHEDRVAIQEMAVRVIREARVLRQRDRRRIDHHQ